MLDNDLLDQPEYEGERSYYMICSTPRTGSTLLCELLRENGVGVPLEYFHATKYLPELCERYRLYSTGKQTSPFSMDRYVDLLKHHRTTTNGYFGVKAHWGQFEWFFRQCQIEENFPGMRYIYITREDTIAQAVSASKAAHLAQWNSTQQTVGKPVYDESHIRFCLRTIEKSNRKWVKFFADRNVHPLHVRFENLLASPRMVVGEVLDHLKVVYSDVYSNLEDIPIKSQYDSINREWIRRFQVAVLKQAGER